MTPFHKYLDESVYGYYFYIIKWSRNGSQSGPFVPRPFDTIEQCERVRLAAIEYIEWAMKTGQIPNYYAGYKVTCKDSEGE